MALLPTHHSLHHHTNLSLREGRQKLETVDENQMVERGSGHWPVIFSKFRSFQTAPELPTLSG